MASSESPDLQGLKPQFQAQMIPIFLPDEIATEDIYEAEKHDGCPGRTYRL